MKKIYEEPIADIEKFQFDQTMTTPIGISRDDPENPVDDPFN